MARPSKYNWEAVKEAYEGGIDIEAIVKGHKVPRKLLTNKIRDNKWVIKGHLKADVEGFYAETHKMAQNVEKLHPINQNIIIEKLNTLEQDNQLVSNNRKIAKMLQGIIVQNRNNITLSNIKNVSGVIKDIESIANPQSSKIELNNTNVNQNTQQTLEQTGISITFREKKNDK